MDMLSLSHRQLARLFKPFTSYRTVWTMQTCPIPPICSARAATLCSGRGGAAI